MNCLVCLVLLIVPLITYPQSADPFTLKTLLISSMGFACLGYVINKGKTKLSSIPWYFLWVFVSFGYCLYKLGHPFEELLLTISYLGIYLYALNYLNRKIVIKVLLISLVVALSYNFIGNHYAFKYSGMSTSFCNKNLYSGWLCLIVPLAIAWAIKGDRIDWIVVIASVITMAGIGCRSSMMALIASLAVFSAFYWHRVGKWLAVAIIVISGLGWWFFTPHQVIDRERAVFWSGTLDLIRSRPLTGYGIGSFQTIYPQFKHITTTPEAGNPELFLTHAHSLPFEMISEVGLIGLGLFLFMVWSAWKRADKTDIYNIALIAGTFAYFVDNNFNIFYGYSIDGLMLFLYLGLLNKKEEGV